jgi:ADP-ribose pyrophosphatase
MPKRLKKLSEEVVHENVWWTYKHDTYEKPNGEPGDYYYGDTTGVAMVIPVCEDGKIALALQYRYLAGKQSIEFPAGGIKENQDVLEAAKQELFEETGWVAEDYTKIGVFEPMPGRFRNTTHVYIAHVVEQHDQQLDDTEDIEVLYRRPDEIVDMIRRGDIFDGLTLSAWALAQNYMLSHGAAKEDHGLKNIFDFFLGDDEE